MRGVDTMHQNPGYGQKRGVGDPLSLAYSGGSGVDAQRDVNVKMTGGEDKDELDAFGECV